MKPVPSTSRPRIAIGGIMHETHTFMEQPTTLAEFIAGSLYRGEELLSSHERHPLRYRRRDRRGQ